MGKGTVNSSELQSKVEKPYAGDISPMEAWELLKRDGDAILIDVRTEPEWSLVGYPDLTTLGKKVVFASWRQYPTMEVNENFADDILKQCSPKKDTKLIFLCKIGGRSLDAACQMTQQGYSQCYNIEGGFEGDLNENSNRGTKNGWKKDNLPWEQR